jgi:hypothetical protein
MLQIVYTETEVPVIYRKIRVSFSMPTKKSLSCCSDILLMLPCN